MGQLRLANYRLDAKIQQFVRKVAAAWGMNQNQLLAFALLTKFDALKDKASLKEIYAELMKAWVGVESLKKAQRLAKEIYNENQKTVSSQRESVSGAGCEDRKVDFHRGEDASY